METILAIDPGGHTGMVTVHSDGSVIWALEVPKEKVIQTMKAFEDLTIVVYEDFIGGGPRTVDAISTLKLIGGIEAFCILFNIPSIRQVPQHRLPDLSAARTYMQPINKSVHVIDAYAHALAYLERRKLNGPSSK